MDWQEWSRYASEFLSRLNGKGIFLGAAAGGRTNTMTASWGSAGVYWGKPVITAPVRLSRFTRELIDRSGVFSVSIPKAGELEKELAYCGAKSGRDMDKFAACGLTAKPGRTLPVPIVGEAWMHIECRVVARMPFTAESFLDDADGKLYPEKNFHVLFHGEVVDFYET